MSQREPGLDGRFVYLPRGKVLGGSSSINAMAYIRGNRADYDSWAADGAKGWSYDDVLPYFRKSESNEWGEDQFHGKFGPLSVCDGRSRHPLMDAFVRAAVEAGHELNSDFNGATQDGFGRYQCTQRNGMRCSTAAGLSASRNEQIESQGFHQRPRNANPVRSTSGLRGGVRSRRTP